MSKWEEEFCDNCRFLIEGDCRKSPSMPTRDEGTPACAQFEPQENK